VLAGVARSQPALPAPRGPSHIAALPAASPARAVVTLGPGMTRATASVAAAPVGVSRHQRCAGLVCRGALLVLVLDIACGPASHPLVAEARADVPRAPASLDDARRGAEFVNAFGLDLLDRNLGTAKGNVAISPWSIATVLAMARAGAQGVTAAEIDKVLHLVDPAGTAQAMNGLGQQLAGRNGTFASDKGPLTLELSAANRAFAQQGLRFGQPFLDGLARDYGAGVGLVDYKSAT